MHHNPVIYDDLTNKAEYLIFGVFLPAPLLSDLDPYPPPVSQILSLTYILTLLVSNTPVSEHKF